MFQEPDSFDAERLVAGKDDPRITVHQLSEFVFCPRAGLCLYEQDDDFHEENDVVANLSYLPIHEREELRRAFNTLVQQLVGIAASGFALVVILCGMAWLSGWSWAWAAPVFASIVVICVGARWLCLIWDAFAFLEIWKDVEPKLPDPDSTKIQEIHWCELLLSKVMFSEPRGSFHKDEWMFGGKPWRQIEYGDFIVPVFRSPKEWKGVFDQHLVRMTAYCQLLEQETGRRSPYGVIVENNNYRAWVLPNTARSQELFVRSLLRARSIIRDSEELNHWPAIPGDGAGCKDCHLGQAQRTQREQFFLRHQTELSWFLPSGLKYHSHCSDRFRTIPPNSELGRYLAQTLETPDR